MIGGGEAADSPFSFSGGGGGRMSKYLVSVSLLSCCCCEEGNRSAVLPGKNREEKMTYFWHKKR